MLKVHKWRPPPDFEPMISLRCPSSLIQFSVHGLHYAAIDTSPAPAFASVGCFCVSVLINSATSMSIALLHHFPASCPLSSSTTPGRDPGRAARNPSKVFVAYEAAHHDEHYGRVLDMVFLCRTDGDGEIVRILRDPGICLLD
jgi:hypothetical protein